MRLAVGSALGVLSLAGKGIYLFDTTPLLTPMGTWVYFPRDKAPEA
jgi:hypothetical protein